MPPTQTDADGPHRSHWIALLIAVAAGLHAAALLNATPLQSANDRSRWSTVWALVERGSFVIDDIDAVPQWQTIDKVQQDGHLYSTKPALLSVIAAGVYAVIRHSVGWSIYADPASVTRVVLAVINLLPWLVALAAMGSMATKYAKTRFACGYVVAATAFGTYLSTYSVTFNNHTAAAIGLIFALFFALRIIVDGSRSWWDFALCGLSSAWVTANELPAAAFGLAMFALMCWYDWRRTLLAFVPAESTAVTATIDRARFDAGEDPGAFVADGEPSSALAAYVIRQLPGQVTYRPGHVRYQKTSLREFAFQTQHVTAAIDARRPTGEIIRHRIDAWLCDDVPFGVVRLRETLTEARSGDWLSQRDFVLTAAGRLDEPDWAEQVKAQVTD